MKKWINLFKYVGISLCLISILLSIFQEDISPAFLLSLDLSLHCLIAYFIVDFAKSASICNGNQLKEKFTFTGIALFIVGGYLGFIQVGVGFSVLILGGIAFLLVGTYQSSYSDKEIEDKIDSIGESDKKPPSLI